MLVIVVVPTRLETLGMDANTRRVFLLQQIQVPSHGLILSAVLSH